MGDEQADARHDGASGIRVGHFLFIPLLLLPAVRNFGRKSQGAQQKKFKRPFKFAARFRFRSDCFCSRPSLIIRVRSSKGCGVSSGVAQIVVRRLAVRLDRVRFPAWYPYGDPSSEISSEDIGVGPTIVIIFEGI